MKRSLFEADSPQAQISLDGFSDPAFYQQPAEETAAALARLQALQDELDQLLERWAELEG